jgi:uncharacterized protein (DUF58 family)
VAAYRRTPARRGLDLHIGFRVATRYPFGLFEKSREIESEGTLVTYPAVDPIRLSIDTATRGVGGKTAFVRGHGDEILGLRPMREGDDPRDIYWRRSANPDQMLLKERVFEGKRTAILTLDDSLPTNVKYSEFLERFEVRIREVASRAVAHLLRGDAVRLRTTSGQNVSASPATGADGILTFLALIGPDSKEPTRHQARDVTPPESVSPAPLSGLPVNSSVPAAPLERP